MMRLDKFLGNSGVGSRKDIKIMVKAGIVTVNGEGAGHTHGKTTTLTIETEYTNSDWYINTEGHQTLNVYLYITYDVQLVECYMDEKAGGSLSLDDNSVFFDNDMKKVSVSYSA